MNEWEYRGALDCYQDRCENVPFSSIGGLEARSRMRTPNYVPTEEAFHYLDGYINQAEEMYGNDWQTCAFGWQRTLVLEAIS